MRTVNLHLPHVHTPHFGAILGRGRFRSLSERYAHDLPATALIALLAMVLLLIVVAVARNPGYVANIPPASPVGFGYY